MSTNGEHSRLRRGGPAWKSVVYCELAVVGSSGRLRQRKPLLSPRRPWKTRAHLWCGVALHSRFFWRARRFSRSFWCSLVSAAFQLSHSQAFNVDIAFSTKSSLHQIQRIRIHTLAWNPVTTTYRCPAVWAMPKSWNKRVRTCEDDGLSSHAHETETKHHLSSV